MQVGIGDIAPRLLHFATWLKCVVTSHHARSKEGTPTPVKNDASCPKNTYGRFALHVNVFLLPGIETRFVCRPVHILLHLLELINFQLYQTSLLYRRDFGADHVGFVVNTVITREVCLWVPIFFPSVLSHQQSVRVFHSSISATIKYNVGSSQCH